MSSEYLTTILCAFKTNRRSLINCRLQLQLTRTPLYFQKHQIDKLFILVLREAYFQVHLVIVDFLWLEVEIWITLTNHCLFLDVFYLCGYGLALVTDKPLGAVTGNVIIIVWAWTSVKTLTDLFLILLSQVGST